MHTGQFVRQSVRLLYLTRGISTVHTVASLSLYIYFLVHNVCEGNQECRSEVVSTPWRHTGRVEVDVHQFPTLAVNGCEWLAARPGRFTPGGKSSRHSLNRRLSGPHSLSEHFGGQNICPIGTGTPDNTNKSLWQPLCSGQHWMNKSTLPSDLCHGNEAGWWKLPLQTTRLYSVPNSPELYEFLNLWIFFFCSKTYSRTIYINI